VAHAQPHHRAEGGDLMSAIEFYTALGIDLPDRPGPWITVHCLNPAHDDRNASCGINVEHGGYRCQACGASGNAYRAAVLVGRSPRDAAELCKHHGLGHWDDGAGGGEGGRTPSDNRATVQQPSGCSLDQYAEHKRLPVETLRSFGVSDYIDSRWPGVRVLRVPYLTADGGEPAVRIRHTLAKPTVGDRFLWRKGSKPLLYGLDRVELARQAGYVVLVEGESDCHTLWHHGVPALGLPGAGGWNEQRDARHVADIARVYVVVEPDTGGEAVLGWLARSAIKDHAWLIELNGDKDPSGLHLADPDRFAERWMAAVEAAEPWRARAAQLEDTERRDVGERCAQLARSERILDALADDAAIAGVTGEVRNVKLIYLVLTSRLLNRLASIVVKGQSSSGKSWTTQAVVRFFPESAYYEMTAASEHALIYDKEPLEHRTLVIYETSGLESEKFSYVVRSLLSEGRLRYPTVVKRDGELETVMIEREGPTNLITTTTALRLHSENETRLLSLASDESAGQTTEVLAALATEDDGDEVDYGQWHALQRWLELGENRVTIPYAKQLAKLVPPVAVRLRRDFGSLLALIRAHALLHQGTRERDAKGRIVATIADYEVVRDLVADVLSEGVEKTVKPEVRELVAKVRELVVDDETEVTQRQLARALRLDKGAVSRRAKAALDAGFLVNREERRGRPHRLVPGDPLPDDQPILPTVEAVEQELHGCTVDRGGRTPTPTPITGVDEQALAKRYGVEIQGGPQ
jgi:hypothetical protein